jgi:hypothetical protein
MGTQEVDLANLENACMDLVSERKYEPFLSELLRKQQKGDWARVQDLCRQSGTPMAGLVDAPHLFVTWLEDPSTDSSFAMIIFYDDDLKWTSGAQYNRSRLFQSSDTDSAPASRQEPSAAV